jgi:hypothetical protein
MVIRTKLSLACNAMLARIYAFRRQFITVVTIKHTGT